MLDQMSDTTQNVLLVALSTTLLLFIAAIAYLAINTHTNPHFFPTELQGVRDDFHLVLVQPQGAPNPNYHPTYASEQKDPNSTN